MHFTSNGSELDYTFMDFCDWAACNRRNKAVLQLLMEYVVGRALGCVDGADRADKCSMHECQYMRNGRKVAVRTGSCVESLYPEHTDWIGFGVGHASPDVFIFCVNRSMQMFSIPTNLDVWDFYVLPGSALRPFSKTNVITLPALLLMQPTKCDFNSIAQAVAGI